MPKYQFRASETVSTNWIEVEAPDWDHAYIDFYSKYSADKSAYLKHNYDQWKMRIDEMKTLNKGNLIRAMDFIIRGLGNYDALKSWLSCGVPDCATNDDYLLIAMTESEFKNAADLFFRLVAKYGKDGFGV